MTVLQWVGIGVAAVGLGVILWLLLRKRGDGEGSQILAVVRQLVPVLLFAGIVIAVLVIIDPKQADTLLSGTIQFIPKAFVAIVVVVLARAAGRILGTLAEATLRRMSPVLASRARLVVSSAVLAIGAIIALDQLGVSTDIIMLLVAGLVGASALAIGLAVGLGTLSVARHVAAGRHVQDRFETGQWIRLGQFEGRIVSMGLASVRLAAPDGTFVEIPNHDFLERPVLVDAERAD